MSAVSMFLRLSIASIALLAGACASPLVGLECKRGYDRCGNACYDLDSDESHCGACDVACAAGQMCVEGACTGGTVDSGAPVDGAMSDAGDGGNVDAGGPVVPPVCTGAEPPDSCVCGLGQLRCGEECRDVTSDPANCGACDHMCNPGGFCVNGQCVDMCEEPLTRCGAFCVDLQNDPNNCGACRHVCESGICVEGVCLGPTAGHVIVMGHDMSSSTAATRRLLGNAVFLSRGDPVKVLLFDEKAPAAAQNGVNAAIMSTALATGREAEITSTSSLAVTFLLATSNVFVIEAQTTANDDSLIKNGESWSGALRTFVQRGNVVVLLDGPGGSNAGTYQILKAAGLFNASTRVELGAKRLSLLSPGDGVAAFVPSLYQSGADTVGFETNEQTVVISEPESDLPVVVHIAR